MIPLDRKWFISSKISDIHADYLITNEIGSGAYGKVFLGHHLRTSAIRAIKIIIKNRVQSYQSFVNEIAILKTLDHPNIVNIIETYENDNLCFLVLEHCSGGEIFARLSRARTFTEAAAAQIMRQLLSAVIFCHNHGIVHRDIKPDNFIYNSPDANSPIKIIDFGLSARMTESELLHGVYGTPYYIAPEILVGNYNQLIDCWSLGVVLYILLSGVPPFTGANNKELMIRICNASFTFNIPQFKNVSKMAKDLIVKLLTKIPENRYTAQQAFMHPWVQGVVINLDMHLPLNIQESFMRFSEATTMKKASLMFIASKLTDSSVRNIKNHFQAIDVNGDGQITKEELLNAITNGRDIPQEQLEVIVNSMDVNGNGVIDYSEFLTGCLLRNSFSNSGYLASTFTFFDRNHCGYISAEDIRQALCGGEIAGRISLDIINAIIAEVDKNKDGFIDYKEFIEEMTNRLG